MAKKQPAKKTSPVAGTQSFSKGMIKDIHKSIQPTTNWSHARNVSNHSVDGDVGVIGNEPANLECSFVPYTIIGVIHKYSDEWIVYSTDDTNSEIGLFDDSKCEYTSLVNDPCLGFKTSHLIIGATKENFDCSWQVYWDDGLNPSRTLNLDNIPRKLIETTAPGDTCVTFEDSPECFNLDCEKLRLAPLLTVPCIKLTKAEDGGQLRNGAYQAYVAYVVNEQRVTDYIGLSNIQTLWDHAGTRGSLNISISNLDREEFEYIELVILSNNQNNQTAKKIGLYSTDTSSISIDFIAPELPSVPLEILPMRSPAYEKSDAMFVVNDYLIRKGPQTQFDFNYQPLATKIQTNWVVKEYPANYYHKGGNSIGLMRDEQYAFFIRWIYNTGEKSKSYHIPGRPPNTTGITQFGQVVDETAIAIGPQSVYNDEYNFQAYNTAFVTQGAVNLPSEDGIILSRGKMAYWESTERYDTRRPEIWTELCGKFIRHHKMPTEETHHTLQLTNNAGTAIRVLGVEFENIERPKYNDGSYIPNIVGYEILRGSREGAKSILGKGIFKNMRKYDVPDSEDLIQSGVQGLYPNYPFNDLRDDIFFSQSETEGCDNGVTGSLNSYPALTGYTKDVLSFHSPELMFRKPFLNASEARIYGQLDGRMTGTFYASENHPQHKLMRNGAAIIAGIIGIGYAIGRVRGDKQFGVRGPNTHVSAGSPYEYLYLGTGGTIPYTSLAQATEISSAAAAALGVTALTEALVSSLVDDLTDIGGLFTGDSTWTEVALEGDNALGVAASYAPGVNSGHTMERYNKTHPTGNLPTTVALLLSQSIGKTNIATGGDEMIELFYNLMKPNDHAFKMNSYGFYNNYSGLTNGARFRSATLDSNYIDSSFQLFDEGKYKVNNLFRPSTVVVSSKHEFDIPTTVDKSRFAIGGDNDGDTTNKLKKPEVPRGRNISCLYGALKFNFENQYGQLDQVKQVVMRGCTENVDFSLPAEAKYTSQPIFDGDTYIGRYTEKCIMPIFTDFLNGQPDNFTYDYRNKINLPYPRFWMDTQKFDMTGLAQEIMSLGLADANEAMPNDLYYLDRGDTCGSSNLTNLFGTVGNPKNPAFSMRYAYMYTHINGISDFFVESEINLAHRDWGDKSEEKIYSSYYNNNVKDLLHADILKDDNFYRYEYSLSPSRFITNLASNGSIQPRDYDPLVAETCHDYYPKRLIYSMRAQDEAKKDFWRVFLPNNKKDFKNKVTGIKPLNRTGAIMFFPYQSPAIFKGVDTLQSDMGTEIYLGDGGVFAKSPQNIMNAETSMEYGSCESLRSITNTPSGLFWISQAQGKIFQYAGKGAENITNLGMKWWFNKYLPSQLIKQLPEIEELTIGDNPVIGVGCQTVYDANDDIVYFCKKDFKIKDEFVGNIRYDERTNSFVLHSMGPQIPIALQEGIYFEDCSWTISYDPKSKAWVSFHDWHPELSVPSINHFFTTKLRDISPAGLCPEGFSYNSVSGMCECGSYNQEPATVTIENIGANITGGPENCLVDIVIAMDVSGSTGNQGRIQAQRAFVQAFLQNSTISAQMAAGDVQVGFTRWSTNHVSSMDPNGYSMSNTITPAAVATYYSPQSQGLTNICSGTNGGAAVLADKSNSELGDRSSDPSFRNVLIVMTDANANNQGGDPQNCGPGSTQVGCQYQNQAGYEVYAVYCHPTSTALGTASQNLLHAISCTQTSKEFIIVANQTSGVNSPSAVADTISSASCGADFSCECPPGYSLVYPDSAGNHTQSSGTCTTTTATDIAPICRRVSCECPPDPTGLGIVTETGTCDDIYLAGTAGYVNTNPLTCTTNTLTTVPPAKSQTGIWRHNYRCDKYANFYGVQYPWEIEVINNTGQLVTTLRSIEYQLESYIYKGDIHNSCGDDRWHDLDFNFDEAIVHNTEQVSGLLNLVLTPKEQPIQALSYPIINTGGPIEILYSKEEQKYRFNQFWDITEDRGEFSTAQRTIFKTECNGYKRELNSDNTNYLKEETQRKKFRHYSNSLFLRKKNSEGRKMIIRLNNFKFQNSQR